MYIMYQEVSQKECNNYHEFPDKTEVTLNAQKYIRLLFP